MQTVFIVALLICRTGSCVQTFGVAVDWIQCVLSLCPFDISVGVGAFCHRTGSDLLLFVFNHIIFRNVFLLGIINLYKVVY